MSVGNPLKKDIDDFKRFTEITEILFEQGFGFVLERLNLLHHVPYIDRVLKPKAKRPAPERVRETFEQLGPVFIKFGQILSERPDLIPEEYCEELEKLEDAVPPFDPEKSKEIVDDEVGLEKFKHFEDEPMASASIAQVHRAELRNGKEVAVKVRRPGIKKQIETDTDILKFMAKKGDKHLDIGHHMIQREAEEFTEWTKKETDLRNEGRNAKRFKENLSDEKRVRIPEIYMEHTTEKVLVMEFIDAVKVDDTEEMDKLDIDEKEVASSGLRSFIKQLLRDGFIHADPHPSNFLVDKEGNLVYLDFGMMADLTPEMQKNIGLLIFYTYKEDIEGAKDVVKNMAYIESDAEESQLQKVVEEMILDLRSSKLEDSSISRELFDLAIKSAECGYYLPTKFVLIGKGLVTMEGIGMKIYPEFEFDDSYQKLVKKLILKNNADPKDMAESFMADLVKNKQLFSKLPSKIAERQERQGEELTVEQKHTQGKIIPASIILGSLYLFSTSIVAEYRVAIGISGVLTALYMVYSKN